MDVSLLLSQARRMLACLEKQSPHASNFGLFFDKDLKILINDCDCQQNPGAGADGTQEISQDRERPDTQASEGSCCRDVPKWKRGTKCLLIQICSLLGHGACSS
uniref:Uncharacterized protein n=1 Tax=Micrurus spixii TaxID=129469 RepID=A0A2D4MDA0_9SAUR